MENIGPAFLQFLQKAFDMKQLRREPKFVYDAIRRLYLNPELKEKVRPGDRDAEEIQLSGEGPDFYEYLGMWYTFCDSNGIEIIEPPPELNVPG